MFGDLCLFWMTLKMSRLLYNCAKNVKLCNILLFLQFLLFSYLHEFKFRNDICLLVWLLLWCWLVCIRPSRKEIFMFEGEALCTDFDKSSPYNFSACVKKCYGLTLNECYIFSSLVLVIYISCHILRYFKKMIKFKGYIMLFSN